MFSFPNPPQLSTEIYEMEDFAHVPPMGLDNFARIESFLHSMNHVNPFRNARLPSLAAMNTFVQLYFEYFHPGFPMLHRPSFNASVAPWALVLAVASLGCRYSKTDSVSEYGNLLQELLRRSIPFLVS